MKLRLLGALWLALMWLSPAHAADPAAPGPQLSQLLVMLRLPPQHFHPDGYGAAYPNDGSQAARRRAAEALASRHGLQVVDSWPMPVIGVDCYVMQVKGADAAAALAALAQEQQVLWASPCSSSTPCRAAIRWRPCSRPSASRTLANCTS